MGENIPISVDPLLVDDSVPTEDNIEWAVRRLMDNHSGGPSGMRVEHLQQWLWEARKVEEATSAVTGVITEAVMETVKEAETYIETGEVGGADAGGLLRGPYGGGIHLLGGGTNPQEGRGILWYFPG